MDNSKRRFLKGAAITGGTGLFVAGYSSTLSHLGRGIVDGTSGEKTRSDIHGNSLAVEYYVDHKTGDITANPEQRIANTMCFGCWTKCGVRAKIDNNSDKILKISGNPYHPLSCAEQISFDTPIKEAFITTSAFKESGLTGRATACARGNAMLENLDSKHRVTQCLKRVGPRGSGQWQTISFETLIKEVTQGGDLFNEGHVDGLKAIRDVKTRLDPNNPEYGPKANQLLVTNAGDEGRANFIKRFTFNSYGTRNYGHHGSYCGFSYRAGAGVLLDDLKKYSHLKPDWDHSEFLLFIGTSPQQSGNPFQKQSRQLAAARTRKDGSFSYAVVSPVLPNTSNMPCAPKNTWIPIKPATDSALAMAMLRWIIDNKRYAEAFLTAPNVAAAKAQGYRGFSNASYLVISNKQHQRFGQFAYASDLNLPFEGKAYGKGDSQLVVDAVSDEITIAASSQKARLSIAGVLVVNAEKSRMEELGLQTSFQLLQASTRQLTLAQYSAECCVPEQHIIKLARKFTSHGTKAAVISHGGTMSANGFYSAWAIMMLNALIGNINAKGGAIAKGGAFPAFGVGPRYNLKKFKGMVKPQGIFLSRSRFPYEKTSEFKRKKEAGENPYPSKEPWFPISAPMLSEHLTAAVNGYPYRLKAWINHMSNPIYGQQGLGEAIGDKLKDPAELPLIVSIDSFINETTALSDYIVPDTLTYESWGWTSSWHGTMAKVSTGRWPIVEPRVAKTAAGDVVCMESFIIAVAKELGLPGFGDNAVKAQDGSLWPLNKAADFSLYGAANVAFYGKGSPPEISQEDIDWSGIERIMGQIKQTLKAEEVAKVAYVLARGGRFEGHDKARTADGSPAKVWPKPLMLWNASIGARRNSLSGEFFSGTPSFHQPKLVDGTPLEQVFDKKQWPLLLSSYKSHTMSSSSIGCDRLRQVHPNNPVKLNQDTAQALGLITGDRVKISTPNGSVFAVVECVAGVQKDCIAIEHGFGHKELGARDQVIDNQVVASNPLLKVGVNLNDLSVLDPSRHGRFPLVDWVLGSSARQGLPAKIEKA